MEGATETESATGKASSQVPLAANVKQKDVQSRCAAKKPGRPKLRWRIRVVRIDSRKYPYFKADREHPFSLMAAEARIREIDSFCARLWARTKMEEVSPASEVRRLAA